MPDFMERRRLTRLINAAAEQTKDLPSPQDGWAVSVRKAMGMSADYVARHKGVSRNAVYQAERSEKEGAVSLKQMEQLAKAMGCRFVYAIVPEGKVEDATYAQAREKARALMPLEPEVRGWSAEEQADWIDDKAAELLHDMPTDFWEPPEIGS